MNVPCSDVQAMLLWSLLLLLLLLLLLSHTLLSPSCAT
jgi:hypothetical protein